MHDTLAKRSQSQHIPAIQASRSQNIFAVYVPDLLARQTSGKYTLTK
jgi:hypothetical protein